MSALTEIDVLPRGAHLVDPAERRKIGDQLVRAYQDGESIRIIAEHIGRSYGFVYRVLSENGVKRRRRGGGSPSHMRPRPQ